MDADAPWCARFAPPADATAEDRATALELVRQWWESAAEALAPGHPEPGDLVVFDWSDKP